MSLSYPTRLPHVFNPDSGFKAHRVGEVFAQSKVPFSLQWLSTFAAFDASGGLISGDGLAQRLIDSTSDTDGESGLQAISLVARWIVSQSVVTVMGPNGYMLPLFQFDLPTATIKPGMAPVLAEFRGVFHEAELALWFVSSNDWLEGVQPAMVMQNNLPRVLDAARADRYLATGY